MTFNYPDFIENLEFTEEEDICSECGHVKGIKGYTYIKDEYRYKISNQELERGLGDICRRVTYERVKDGLVKTIMTRAFNIINININKAIRYLFDDDIDVFISRDATPGQRILLIHPSDMSEMFNNCKLYYR